VTSTAGWLPQQLPDDVQQFVQVDGFVHSRGRISGIFTTLFVLSPIIQELDFRKSVS
jgi:hypothetical protein